MAAVTPVKINTGRRKAVAPCASCRAPASSINGRSLEEYFPTRVHRMVAVSPLRVSGREKDYDVIATIRGGRQRAGGGDPSGIARALIELDPSCAAR